MKQRKRRRTDTEGQRVGDGSDGDGDGCVLQRLTETLLDALMKACVAPGRHQDVHVVHADTCKQVHTRHVSITLSAERLHV